MVFEPSLVITLVAAFFTIVFLPMFISYMVTELSLGITFVATFFAIVLSLQLWFRTWNWPPSDDRGHFSPNNSKRALLSISQRMEIITSTFVVMKCQLYLSLFTPLHLTLKMTKNYRFRSLVS